MGVVRTEQVRAVLAIAETASFRAAAIRLGMSQSALSATVRRLEDELGVTLLTRSHDGTHLSPAGTAALRAMRAICAADEDLRATVRAYAAGGTELIRVAAVTAAINTVLPGCLNDLVVDPGVEVQVRIGGSGDVIDQIRSGRADLGLITLEHGAHPVDGVRMHTLLSSPMGVVVPAGHRLAAQPEVRVIDLAGERVVNFRAGYMMHRVATGLLDVTDVRVVSHVESTPDAVRLVAAGMGVCLLPGFSVAERDPVVWREFVGVDAPITLALVVAADATPTDRVRRLGLEIRRRSASSDPHGGHQPASANTTVRVTV